MTYACIIPFYNEGERILKTLSVVSKIDQFNEIICIDDGSEDKASEKITKLFPNVELVQFSENRGKSEAVKQGVKQSSSEVIFLLDADLTDLNQAEIKKAIKNMEKSDYDMIILKLAEAITSVDFARSHVLLAGQRLFFRSDFQQIIENEDFNEFQLEIAINKFMRKKDKKVGWMKSSLKTPKKIEKREDKWGAIKEDYTMFKNIILYSGVSEYLLQLLLFAKEEVH
ncbi:MAG: hypothetical protein BRC22_01150 [Parcubacteria group bacterium QH_9_35_7]|nr:MAG: hypothetical protein BRC22_01150 [Parcubacteria group bacterium QH_9_35_7]